MMRIKSLPTLLVFLTMFLTACSSTHTLEKRVNEDNYKSAVISEQATKTEQEPYRLWMNESSSFLFDETNGVTPLRVNGEQLNILVLSGGGANGAFGAGVISGLYDSGQLEEYTVVTGISAGAMIAPFVFVGGEELPRLKEVMLGLNDKMVLGNRNFLNALIKDAFTDGKAFYHFIESVYTPEMIQKIAQEHQAGRRLFIGTTQFDSDQLMIWNLGRIADSNLPNKEALIHQILSASASIPGVFPPQFIQVEQNGKHYEELHVDGGLASQMFFDVAGTDFYKVSKALGLTLKPKVHVIRNGVLNLPYSTIPDKGVALLGRTVKSMTVQQSRGDLYRMLYFSELEGLDLSFTYIEEQFDAPHETKQMFDQQYMQSLFEHGYNKSKEGDVWTKEMP